MSRKFLGMRDIFFAEKESAQIQVEEIQGQRPNLMRLK